MRSTYFTPQDTLLLLWTLIILDLNIYYSFLTQNCFFKNFYNSWLKFLWHVNSLDKKVWVQDLDSQAKYQRFSETSVDSYYKHIHVVLVTNKATSENFLSSRKSEIKEVVKRFEVTLLPSLLIPVVEGLCFTKKMQLMCGQNIAYHSKLQYDILVK